MLPFGGSIFDVDRCPDPLAGRDKDKDPDPVGNCLGEEKAWEKEKLF